MTGLCYWGIAVVVVGVEGGCEEDTVCIPPCCDDSACLVLSCLVLSYCVVGCGMAGCVVSSLVFSLLSVFPLSFPLVGGVRGSARAALRARTLSPNTIASLLLLALSSLCPPLFFIIRLSCYCGMAVCDSPCVGVLCWHDCDG